MANQLTTTSFIFIKWYFTRRRVVDFGRTCSTCC